MLRVEERVAWWWWWSAVSNGNQSCLLSPKFPCIQSIWGGGRGNQESSCPTTNNGMQIGSSVGIRTRCVHVIACLAPTCVPSRCLSTKTPASELCRKFIKSALLVGWQVLLNNCSLMDHLEKKNHTESSLNCLEVLL